MNLNYRPGTPDYLGCGRSTVLPDILWRPPTSSIRCIGALHASLHHGHLTHVSVRITIQYYCNAVWPELIYEHAACFYSSFQTTYDYLSLSDNSTSRNSSSTSLTLLDPDTSDSIDSTKYFLGHQTVAITILPRTPDYHDFVTA